MNVEGLVPPLVVEALGWSLVHFLWQGLVLALILRVFLMFSREASVRYWAAVGALTLMAVVPIMTFTALLTRAQASEAIPRYVSTIGLVSVMGGVAQRAKASLVTDSLATIDWAAWFVVAWFVGVFAFTLRLLGSWVLVLRFYGDKRETLFADSVERFQALQRRLGISRAIGYFQTTSLDAPAVIGWFRPKILLPVAALTGLSPAQLEAVIVHELAHIRRFDSFVNLFQLVVETVLFYHPAVWWASTVVRREREHCCDDLAVQMCGDVGIYARALTLMESWRAAPHLAMAANTGSLKSRIRRLIAPAGMRQGVSPAGLAAVGVACLAGALLASTNFTPKLTELSNAPNPSFRIVEHGTSPQLTREDVGPGVRKAPALKKVARVQANDTAAQTDDSQKPAAPSRTEESNQPSYIEGLRAAGLKDITVDELISMKVQGVTPEYVREIHSAGLEPNVGEIIAMKVQGVTPEYARTVRRSWPNTNVGEIIAMKVQGVSPADAAEFRSVGLNNLNVGQLIAFRVQGVTPAYVRGLQSAGFTSLNAGEVIAAKVQGITPEFAQKIRSHGFTDVSLHQLIALKAAGVF